MKLNCIEIAINDEELGCQVTFSEKKDLGEETANMTVQEITNSIVSKKQNIDKEIEKLKDGKIERWEK